MRSTGALLLLIALAFLIAACSSIFPGPPDSQPLASVKPNEAVSPFTQFENLKKEENGFDSEQVDNILRSYGIYEKVLAKVPKEAYAESICSDVRISGYTIGNKKVAVLLIEKGHLHIYVMLSSHSGQWAADGFAYQTERDEPEYRIEQSGDGTSYWLAVRHESNHGTGLYIYEDVWYNPDGTIAAEYPVEGSTWFFPENIEPYVNTYFSASAYYDGGSQISLSYSISFTYGYKDKFQSEYRPVIRDNWEYDLKTRQFYFVPGGESAFPESRGTVQHKTSSEYGILQGYIDFYRTGLGDKKITSLEEWEQFMETGTAPD
jgi:hypothetical protein